MWYYCVFTNIGTNQRQLVAGLDCWINCVVTTKQTLYCGRKSGISAEEKTCRAFGKCERPYAITEHNENKEEGRYIYVLLCSLEDVSWCLVIVTLHITLNVNAIHLLKKIQLAKNMRVFEGFKKTIVIQVKARLCNFQFWLNWLLYSINKSFTVTLDFWSHSSGLNHPDKT